MVETAWGCPYFCQVLIFVSPLLSHSPRRLQAAACKADDLRSDMGIAMPDLLDPEEGVRQSKRTRLVDPEEELIGPSLAWRQSEHARLTRWVCAVYMYGCSEDACTICLAAGCPDWRRGERIGA